MTGMATTSHRQTHSTVVLDSAEEAKEEAVRYLSFFEVVGGLVSRELRAVSWLLASFRFVTVVYRRSEAARDPNLVCSDGRTPEEEWQYRADNRLPLRSTPPSFDEYRRWTDEILEEDSELLQRLADA